MLAWKPIIDIIKQIFKTLKVKYEFKLENESIDTLLLKHLERLQLHHL